MPSITPTGGQPLQKASSTGFVYSPDALVSVPCQHMTACLQPSLAARINAVSVLALAGRSLMPRVRHRVFFSGRVQGVGFRFTCHSLARGFEIAGHVRNLPDGQVELIAEGEPAELDRFLAAIRLEMSPYIKNVQVETGPTSPEPLVGFSIRY
jgi:acylphosphatase